MPFPKEVIWPLASVNTASEARDVIFMLGEDLVVLDDEVGIDEGFCLVVSTKSTSQKEMSKSIVESLRR